ncbi:MAG: DUF3810 domain-containing protein [Oscillospiraceae bacterium]|nr:DUF3810 domain-containing protein [Oscillospiraceae bacterium]
MSERRRYRFGVSLGILFGAALLGGAGWLVWNWLKGEPAWITETYRPFSRAVLGGLSRVFSFVPFSAAEILLYLAILAVLFAVGRLIWVLISGRAPRLRYLVRFVSSAALIAVIAAELYYILWGMNYFGKTLAEELGYDVHPRGAEELEALAVYLTEQANAAAKETRRDETGALADGYTFDYLAEQVAAEFSGFSGRDEAKVKYVLASRWLSEFRTTGIFVAYTGESNVNRDNCVHSLSFSMAHETAHRWAVAREDEANFVAFLVLYDADEPLLRYNAYLTALRYVMSQLNGADRDAYARVYSLFGDEIRADNAEYSVYWSQFQSKAAEVSEKTNNAYLTVNGQSDGVKSYGRMVDLLLAWAERRPAE